MYRHAFRRIALKQGQDVLPANGVHAVAVDVAGPDAVLDNPLGDVLSTEALAQIVV